MDRQKKSRSMYEPYYYKIQELLFDGMTIKDAWRYMEKYFQIYAVYETFLKYVKARKLDWFMPERGNRK